MASYAKSDLGCKLLPHSRVERPDLVHAERDDLRFDSRRRRSAAPSTAWVCRCGVARINSPALARRRWLRQQAVGDSRRALVLNRQEHEDWPRPARPRLTTKR